jgi:hypothetical protein
MEFAKIRLVECLFFQQQLGAALQEIAMGL